MKSSIAHLPERKQRELARVVEVLHEEFEDALKDGSADFKKRGRILKIILFGSYGRGNWVDEPHTKKGYRSDYDILVVVNNSKLTDFGRYWAKAQDRLLRLSGVETPVSLIVHSRREVNTALYDGRYFFVDIRRDGVVLYELDDEPLAIPKPLTPADAHRVAKEHYETRIVTAVNFLQLSRSAATASMWKEASFLLHQSIEQAYATVLLVLTNHSPASHNLKFLRGLAEEQHRELAEVWRADQQRFVSWFNIVNEAYVKARYSQHYEITEEALVWLLDLTETLIDLVEKTCRNHLERLNAEIESARKMGE
ncbi:MULTISPECIES: nucleotidyltransferase and HEPN domain-containing protein [unclassified Ensifer]|uniref:nucleotidyltransferase and HEPN domain-containing protein n=1 Tax=unclassified Ensifer TaxID=2633371 RepID=UPI0008134ED3|nr:MULTISPECIES: nucleotidyltransferase and HEPN domain-containing protein [unclassified Ensifer]OCP21453.1 nucleotidyltransferase [Ensifer sp. LC54]OCP26889.1 nucleotidyltransferase [Ensifer sp. LC384]